MGTLSGPVLANTEYGYMPVVVMEYRTLGICGPKVPTICFGAYPIGGGLGTVDENQAINTVQSAIESGITFIDTAESYGTSETIIGKAITGRRHEVTLATKLSGSDHSDTHIQSAINNSLKYLKTDYIDLYQLHSPQPKWPIEHTMASLIKLKEQGKIRYIGVSNFSDLQTKEAMKHIVIHSSQPRYNMLFPHLEESTLDFCKKSGIGVIAHSVLAKGLLGGKYSPGHKFAVDDERRLFNFFRGQLFIDIHAVTTKLSEWAKSHQRDIVQLAIAWVLANKAVTSAIVGMKTIDQVKHVTKAADWKLSRGELIEIHNLIGGLQPSWIKDPTV